ncbi:MAG: head GIN domain-containing protein [Flavobacteriales bacterium]
MIKNVQILVVVLFLGGTFLSCDKENKCVKSSGDNTIETRAVSVNFTEVELNNKINLIIKHDSTFSLKVEAGANLLPLITTEVSGNKLTIKSDNKCSFLRSYSKVINVYLSTPNLTKINFKGQGDVLSANTLNFPNLEIEANKATGSIYLGLYCNSLKILQHTGSADFTFVGQSENTYLYSNGNGWFHFENFSSNGVHVNSTGTGDMLIKANNSLLVELTGIGNVYYYGNPTVMVSNHSGSGEIKKR